MPLSSDLVSQFAKVTDDSKVVHKENRLRGTIVRNGDDLCVMLDGSGVKTPVAKVDTIGAKDENDEVIVNNTTVGLDEGDRVEVEIKNHTAVVTGNLSNPSMGVVEGNDMRTVISQNEKEIKLLAEKGNDLSASLSVQADQIQSLVKQGNDLSASITNTATEIRTEVKNAVEGVESKITETANEIRTEVKGKDDEFTKFIQDVNKFEFMGKGGSVKIEGGSINLTGAITFGQLDSEAQKKITDAQNTANSAQSTANSAKNAASEAQADADKAYEQATAAAHEANQAKSAAQGAVNVFEGFLTTGTDSSGLMLVTYIDGTRISANSIYSNMLHLGGLLTVYDDVQSSNIGGYLGYNPGYSSSEGIGIWNTLTGSQVVCSNQAARLSYGETSSFVAAPTQAFIDGQQAIYLEIGANARVALWDKNLSPAKTGISLTLGTATLPWSAVYASTGSVSTSDRNQKNSIEDLPEKYVAMFDQLQPKRFKLNSGTSDRYHVGYIAQEVEDAMASAGIDSQEFGGLVKDKDENGDDVYLLRYSEFDAIRDAKIKQLESENNDLKSRIETLEKLVAQLLEER